MRIMTLGTALLAATCAIGIRPNHANRTGDYADYRRRD